MTAESDGSMKIIDENRANRLAIMSALVVGIVILIGAFVVDRNAPVTIMVAALMILLSMYLLSMESYTRTVHVQKSTRQVTITERFNFPRVRQEVRTVSFDSIKAVQYRELALGPPGNQKNSIIHLLTDEHEKIRIHSRPTISVVTRDVGLLASEARQLSELIGVEFEDTSGKRGPLET